MITLSADGPPPPSPGRAARASAVTATSPGAGIWQSWPSSHSAFSSWAVRSGWEDTGRPPRPIRGVDHRNGSTYPDSAASYSFWYLINVQDRPLDPGVSNILQQHHDAVPPQDNLLFALLAFDSTSPNDINRQGQVIYAAYLARRAADPELRITFDNAVPVVRQAFVGNRPACAATGENGKTASNGPAAHPEARSRLITDNRLLLDRYDGVAGYTRLQNPVDGTANLQLAPWWLFMLGKHLFLTDIALEVGAGHVDQGISRLGPDIAFTRRLLAQPDILLIDKMVDVTVPCLGVRPYEFSRSRRFPTGEDVGWKTNGYLLARIGRSRPAPSCDLSTDL